MSDGGTARDDEDGQLTGPGYDRVDATVFRDTLARVPTPVTVVTSHVDRRPHGTTVSAFSSLSLEPPMILVSLDLNSDLLKVIQESGRFGVNVLAAGQHDVSDAMSRRGTDRFAGVDWSPSGNGVPRLAGAAAWIECEIAAEHPGGDHTIVVGSVLDLDSSADLLPLLYHRGRYALVSDPGGPR
jgi:3-hydroxy-9,10-secoandrosta-1,3,5(10)-triene-9,17-dione monooxygenase reductase component